MKAAPVLALLVLAIAAPAAAERLEFDHRLYPPLQQVFDGGDKDMIDFNSDNPARVVDLIAVKGHSAKDWTEAMEIVSIPRPKGISTAREWMKLIAGQAPDGCRAASTVLAEDATSVTFERRLPGCPAARASLSLYRLVTGKRSWFQLGVLAKGELDPASRSEWLALLASARIR